MSDDERLQRLTELARRVWPEADIQPHYGLGNKLRGYGAKATQAAYSDGITVWHPRALDALEAALHMLAGETPAWVEELASEWERAALYREERGAFLDGAMANALREHAAELRERARQR